MLKKCPECKSKRINEVPGYNDTKNRKTYYCMDCEREFDEKGKKLVPIYV